MEGPLMTDFNGNMQPYPNDNIPQDRSKFAIQDTTRSSCARDAARAVHARRGLVRSTTTGR